MTIRGCARVLVAMQVAAAERLVVERLDFERLYACYAIRVRQQLRRLGVSDARLDDAAQEVWTIVHRRLKSFDRRSRVTTWLFGIQLNVARHERRRLRRRPPAHALCGEVAAGPGYDPEVMRSGRELWRSLSAFAARLAPPDRELFASVLLEGCSAEEAARRSGLEVRRVYERSRALRKALAASLWPLVLPEPNG